MNVEYVVSSCEFLLNSISVSDDYKNYFFIVVGLFFLSRIVASVIKTKRRVVLLKKDCDHKIPSKLQKIIDKHEVSNDQILMSCDLSLIAVSVGFFDRKIIFSKSLIRKLTSKELEAVFLHELHHANNHHASILLFGQIISEALFFLPVLKDIFINLNNQFEKKADHEAVRYQKTTGFIRSSLIKLLGDNDRFKISPRLSSLNDGKSMRIFSFKRSLLSILFFVLVIIWRHLNSNYAVALAIEEKINCNIFECARNCVVEELFSKEKLMSSAEGVI